VCAGHAVRIESRGPDGREYHGDRTHARGRHRRVRFAVPRSGTDARRTGTGRAWRLSDGRMPLRQVMRNECGRGGCRRSIQQSQDCKRIANAPRVTSRQEASPDDMEVRLELHVSALFGTRRQPASRHLGSSYPEVDSSNLSPATKAKPLLRGRVGRGLPRRSSANEKPSESSISGRDDICPGQSHVARRSIGRAQNPVRSSSDPRARYKRARQRWYRRTKAIPANAFANARAEPSRGTSV